MPTFKIYALDDRNVNEYDNLECMQGLLNGSYYYAGSVEADDLEGAWMATQNDNHPNALVRVEEGTTFRFGTLADLLSECQGDYQEVERQIKRRGYKVLPAVWNGEFPQRSSKVGDVFMVDGELHRVDGAGFSRLAGGESAEVMVAEKNMKANPWAPKREINEDFDQLITDA